MTLILLESNPNFLNISLVLLRLECSISESKKFTNEDGSFYFKKHKIYLYKEDFQGFNELMKEMTKYIIDEKGLEVISERHQKDYVKEDHKDSNDEKVSDDETKNEDLSDDDPDKI